MRDALFSELSEMWLRSIQASVKESTWIKYRNILKCSIVPRLGNTNLSEIDYNAIVKTRKKGFRETAKCGKSLGIPIFLGFLELFYLFRDRRHTVSTWVELFNEKHTQPLLYMRMVERTFSLKI